VPQLNVDIDREKARILGVPMHDVFATLQVSLGSIYVDRFNKFGRTWQVKIQFDGRPDKQLDAEKIGQLKVRNAQGEMVALSSFVTVRTESGMAVVDRLDCWPMARVTSNPAAGVALADARALCETVAEEARKELGLSAEYRLVWMQE